MKICLVMDFLPGYHKNWGGAEVVGFSLGKAFEKEGQSVSILTSQFDCKKSDPPKNIFQIKTPFNGINSKLSFLLTSFPLDVFSILCSIYVLKKTKPDIIHFHAKKLFLPVMVAGIFLRIPTVFTVHDYFILCPRLILTKPNGEICKRGNGVDCAKCFSRGGSRNVAMVIFFYLRAKVLKYFIGKLKALVAITETSKKRLKEYEIPDKKIEIIYQYRVNLKNNLSKENFFSPRDPSILFSGAICGPHKGLHVAIQAMANVVAEFPKAKLLVTGKINNNLYQKEIDDLVNNLNLKKNIEFIGQKENEEILQMIVKSNIVIIPEQWPNDPGPIIAVESMALGKPIVASDIGGIPEFIQDGFNGLLAKYNQPEQFAEKIVWLLKNELEANLIGQRAKKSIEKLLNKSQTEEIIKLYQKLIA